jgi:hypothetical protein
MILEFKTIDITTSKGWEKAIKYKSDPQWKLVTGSFMGTEMLFEKEQEQEISDCCEASIIPETDICSKCNEHCEKIIDGLIYSSELDKWVKVDEYYKNK